MKRWQETSEILTRLAALRGSGRQAAIATVVHISGSAYRRPGAKFLVAEEGATLGGISGGCLEEDVRQAGLQVIEEQRSRRLHYETGEDDDALWGLGLGCNGEVDVFVQPASTAAFEAAADQERQLLGGDTPFAVLTFIESTAEGHVAVSVDGALASGSTGDDRLDREILAAAGERLTDGRSEIAEITGSEVFVEVFEPPPYAVVCGAGDDAIPLVQAASTVGFRVVVVDHRPAYLTEARFSSARRLIEAHPEDEIASLPASADTFVVLKTHNLVRDKAWARRFLSSPVPYVGLLGPRARCEEIADEAPEAHRRRIFGPVGLDLGAEGPEQVGLAIVSELLAVRSRRRPGHLKDRQAPIHA